jgi:DNA-binding NarL/FixJ family response regulator
MELTTGANMNMIVRPTRVLARHHDALVAEGIRAVLNATPGIEVVTPSDGLPLPDVDVLVCDYDSGIAWATRSRRADPPTQRVPGVVIITWRDGEADVRAAAQCGVAGYLLGNCGRNELVDAVRAVERAMPYFCQVASMRIAKSLTRTPLTFREREILQLIARGMPNKLIASELAIALGTVKAHVKAILDKLDATSRTQAMIVAAERGLLDPQSPLRAPSVTARRMSSPSRDVGFTSQAFATF